MKRYRNKQTPMERLAALRLQPRRLNLMAALRRRRYYKNGVLNAPKNERLRSKVPFLRAFNREFLRLFSEWKVWEIHRNFVCPDMGQEVFELCHLWRFRQTAPDHWILEHRRLSAKPGQSRWAVVEGYGTFPELHMWPFHRREVTRANRLRVAVWDHLALFAMKTTMRRLGLKNPPSIGLLRKIVFKRWEQGILRDQRVLVGLRCFVNDVWKRVLSRQDFSRLVAMKGFGAGVSTTDVAAYMRSRPAFVQWDSHPNLWPLVGKWIDIRFQGQWLIEQVTPANLSQWLLGPEAKAHQKQASAFSDYPFPAGNSKREVEGFLAAPSSMVKAMVQYRLHRRLSYWGVSQDVLTQLDALPIADRAVLAEWMGSFRNWRAWRPLCQRMLERYGVSRLESKPSEGRWPEASFSKASSRLQNQIMWALESFRKPPKKEALEKWQDLLPVGHTWVLENRRNHLELAFHAVEDAPRTTRARL